jgi:transposase
VRLIPPQYVKPYVKRNKTDAADAEAICEAVARPNMRFVPIKTVEQQGILALHRVRSLLVRQRTAAVNAIRGLMAEFGVVAGKGTRRISTIRAASERTRAGRLPGSARRAAWAWYVDGAIGSTLQIGLILSLSKDDPVNSTVTRTRPVKAALGGIARSAEA